MNFKLKNITLATVLLALGLNSCYDEKMDWGLDKKTPIDESEIPLTPDEILASYEPLKTYADFPLGAGVDLTLYMENESYRNLANENFDILTVGYHMKHGPMVGSGGELKYTSVDQFFSMLPSGMPVYGHTLTWHQNQNGAYLRSLIAPTVIPPSAGSNLVDLSGLQDGSFTGWNKTNNAAGITIANGAGLSSSDPAIKFVTTANSKNEWDTQLKSPDIAAVEGHAYMLTFWVRSEQDGQIRVSFDKMSNGYPWNNGAALIPTSSTWKQVSYGIDKDLLATGTPISFNFDFGKNPNVTYYVDVNSIKVVDLDAEEGGEANLVVNGNFESGTMEGWTIGNASAGIEVSNAQKYEGNYAVQMAANTAAKNAWDLQLKSDPMALTAGKSYTFSFMIKSDREGKGRVSFPGNSNEWPWMDWTGGGASETFTTATSWQLISVDLDNLEFASGKNALTLSFDLGCIGDVTYWVDDVKLIEKVTTKSSQKNGLRAGPIIVEKTLEEKKKIIGDALTYWINNMVGHYKDKVRAWDVVNEPMLEDGSGVRHGNYSGDEEDIFHWQDFLGDDYAVMAFNLARAAGNPDDKLFINDYNLEYNIDKCKGLIEYVKEIETKGVRVDGIGTQMHIDIDSDMDQVKQMFELLAATGKLIRVTELDVKVKTASATPELFDRQADVYRQVASLYKTIIPSAQQYGLVFWGIDDPSSWIEEDAPCLWDGQFNRKPAYGGVVEGLNGE